MFLAGFRKILLPHTKAYQSEATPQGACVMVVLFFKLFFWCFLKQLSGNRHTQEFRLSQPVREQNKRYEFLRQFETFASSANWEDRVLGGSLLLVLGGSLLAARFFLGATFCLSLLLVLGGRGSRGSST